MSRSERQGDLVLWAAMGLGMGILAGFALAETVGRVDRKRVARAVEKLGAAPAPGPLPPAKAAVAAFRALARTPRLATLEIETRGIATGQVELTGWVPDRARRALAERTVASLEGITGVVNRLLVENEDSDAPPEDGRGSLKLEGQSA